MAEMRVEEKILALKATPLDAASHRDAIAHRRRRIDGLEGDPGFGIEGPMGGVTDPKCRRREEMTIRDRDNESAPVELLAVEATLVLSCSVVAVEKDTGIAPASASPGGSREK